MLSDAHMHLDRCEPEQLRKFVEEARKKGVAAMVAASMNVESSVEAIAIVFHQWQVSDVIAPAKVFLLERVNDKLKDRTSPRLLLNKREELKPYIVPHHLLGALWFQLYQAIGGERQFKRCSICQEWMDVTGCRKTKRMHDSCSLRERMYRWRNKK